MTPTNFENKDQQAMKDDQDWKSSVIPVEALEDERQRSMFQQADIIFGYFTDQDRRTLFYGRALAEEIIATGVWRGKAKVITFALDSRTDALEYLYAACQVLKGRCDYESGTDTDALNGHATSLAQGHYRFGSFRKFIPKREH